MKIVNVTPGLIPIPPNGWGAVEKIIWETHLNLQKLGHDSHITYLDDVPSDADIVHIHVANLALMAKDRGIPYYFTTHDHHAYLYGKDSWVYQENINAMKGAIKSFVPAKFLVDYFEGIPEYFSHGVNAEYFIPNVQQIDTHKLLCVANNGYAGDQSVDRKGFGIAIKAAKELNLPITIAGPSNNRNYFEKNPPTYDKLTILYDLSEEELLTLYQNHNIFIHASELEAGHPNLTMLEALSCGLPVIGTLEYNSDLKGIKKITQNVTDIITAVREVITDYPQYNLDARYQAEELSWYNRTKELLKLYESGTSMKDKLLKHYSNTKITKQHKNFVIKNDAKITFHAIDGAFLEILGEKSVKYHVDFIDKKTNTSVYSLEMGNNSWARTSKKYYVDWKVVIRNLSTNEVIECHLNLKHQRVLIGFESKSLGDTLAWMPYVEEFRKKHECKVICSTFWNQLFENKYPDIEFVKPGQAVRNLAALYRFGLFYTNNQIEYSQHPQNPIQIPLQQIASDILGLEFEEIRPELVAPETTITDSKQVCIAVHSTSQAKYWNNPDGWQQVVDWLNKKGYTVRLLSQEGNDYMGNKVPTGVINHPAGPIESVMQELRNSKAFIGLGSGLSWLSWSLNVPTVLISGFSYDWAEMKDCIRITAPEGKCSGCFNRHRLDPGDWNWCPDHKGTPRQFECSREITADMVIKELEKIL